MKQNKQTTKGFTLFVSLIVTSVLLAVGFSIGNIVLKQLSLSSSGRESQVAFFAADSGAECAMYWDRKNGAGLSVIDSVFATSSNATIIEDTVKCGTGYDGQGAISNVAFLPGLDNLTSTTTFYVNLNSPLDSKYRACAKVTVSKNGPFTIVESRGYNSSLIGDSLGACDISQPRTVERGLRLNY
ncbi:MAG: hypothetical protein RL094_767 [Candidatus Parcubacteria bacterium]|jgi:competence protein ComGC